jgi:hypothetical protein
LFLQQDLPSLVHSFLPSFLSLSFPSLVKLDAETQKEKAATDKNKNNFFIVYVY